MKFSSSTLFFLPVACLLAQTPTPKPAAPASSGISVAVEKPGTTATVPPDKVVLSVGNTKLTAAQFEEIIDSLPEQYRTAARGNAKKQFADNLVRVMVLAEEGKRLKLDQSPAFKTQQQFQADNLLAGKAFAEISQRTAVDDGELHKYYDAHKSDYEQIRARHILIRMAGSPVPVKPGEKDLSDAEALAKTQDLRKQIVGGADFAALASKESDDAGSAKNGGDLNFFHRGQMVGPFEQAAFALNVGQISEPVKSPFGYHLIKVEAKESKTFDEAKPDIEKHLRPELAQKQIEELEKKASVTLDPEFFGAGAPTPSAPATK